MEKGLIPLTWGCSPLYIPGRCLQEKYQRLDVMSVSNFVIYNATAQDCLTHVAFYPFAA